MDDQDPVFGYALDRGTDQFPVFAGDLETVLLHQRFDLVVKADISLAQQFPDDRVTEMKIAFGVVVNLVEGAAGGQYADGQCRLR